MMEKSVALVGFLVFYLIYLGKAWLLKKQGIKVDLLGDKPPSKEKKIEVVLKFLTGLGALLQFIAPFFFEINQTKSVYVGLVLILLADVLFFLAVWQMGLNWRAGFNEAQQTELVTTGIYHFSRNPAFVAFDLLYLGFAVVFPTVLMIGMTILAVLLFDFQIRGEEAYLTKEFGEDYKQYKKTVRRYI
ncbi:methyltransferase family protein [Enterococcus sp. AZ048]|uniref:methyltransferase family protein n=1 Tax=Enterococcus sp. AZ048 TaxID=2774658 RepID=UPI003F68CC6B